MSTSNRRRRINSDNKVVIINLENDEVEWFEDFDAEDQEELETETENAIKEATAFYDNEVAKYDE